MNGTLVDLIREYSRLQIWDDQPINLHSRTMLGDTLLQVATARKDVDAVRILLLAGAHPDETGDMSETALHGAVKKNQYEIASLLLSAGASQEFKSEFGNSPIDLVFASGDSVMLEIFKHFGRGLVTAMTDPRALTTAYTYDNGGRPTFIDRPGGTTLDLTLTYDLRTFSTNHPIDSMKGKLSRVVAGSGLTKTDLGYVPLATGDQKAWKLFYPGQTYTVYESYDTENRLASLQYPSAQAVVYDRDGDGRITRIRLKTGTNTYTTIVDLVSYKPNGPIASLKYGDGYTETLTYDASYRLTGMLDANATVTLRNLSLAYDAKDNLTGVTDNLAGANSEALTYSPRDMLATATGAYGTLAWTYDGVGNRLSEVRGAITDTYSYPATSNRLSSVATSSGGTRALGYDAAGNVITDNRAGQAYGYTYDNANRMASVTLNGVTQATYLYNYLGQQVIRTLTPSGTTIHSIYAPDGNRIAEYTAAGVLIRQYIWMDLKPVAIVEGGVVYYVRSDWIGRPVFATTSAGTVVWKAAYKPFGGVSTTTGTPPDNRFPGQWFQTESGLYQNWMRNYDPATGRYIQADPLGLVDGASVYGYVRGNPERWIDPRGEDCRSYILPDGNIGLICDSRPYCPSGSCSTDSSTQNNRDYDACLSECRHDGPEHMSLEGLYFCQGTSYLVWNSCGPIPGATYDTLCSMLAFRYDCEKQCAGR